MTYAGTHPHTGAGTADALRGFLTERLTEELAALWDRDLALSPDDDGLPDGDGGQPGTGPRRGLASQLGVLDDLLRLLQSRRLPTFFEVRLLLLAYVHHQDYDPAWTSHCTASSP